MEHNDLYLHNETREERRRYKPYLTKTVLFFSLLILIGVQNNSIRERVDCLYDFGISILTPFSAHLYSHNILRNTLITISSLLIDLLAIGVVVIWIGWGKSWRFVFSAASFYIFRAFVQFVYNMPFPKYYCFFSPGFPSLLVSYLKTNDFFYSGHVAMPLLCGFEYINQKKSFMMLVCIFSSVYQGFVMVSTNAHYGVDIIFGWIFALYSTEIFTDCIWAVDKSCMSINDALKKLPKHQ